MLLSTTILGSRFYVGTLGVFHYYSDLGSQVVTDTIRTNTVVPCPSPEFAETVVAMPNHRQRRTARNTCDSGPPHIPVERGHLSFLWRNPKVFNPPTGYSGILSGTHQYLDRRSGSELMRGKVCVASLPLRLFLSEGLFEITFLQLN